jgi:hypothetical protein
MAAAASRPCNSSVSRAIAAAFALKRSSRVEIALSSRDMKHPEQKK